MYQLTLEKFSGPLDILLNLVEEEKLSINEISLAHVADQYITYLKTVEELSKQELTGFLVIAATLILIKSRSLIPHMEISSEEQLDIKELEQRLKTYQFFKQLAALFVQLQKNEHHLFGREAYMGMHAVFFPPDNIGTSSFAIIVRELLAAIPTHESLPTDTIGRTVSIEEKMIELKSRLEKTIALSFDEMKKAGKQKLDIIVSFLAILELLKEGFVLIEQERAFDTITVSKNSS